MVQEGSSVSFGETEYVVAGVITAEPTSLFGGFRFLPRVVLSDAGFDRAGVDMSLLRVEYEYAAEVPGLPNGVEELATELYKDRTIDVDFAGTSRTGLERGLGQVSEFLIVAVLITAVLAAVNVYASTLYVLSILRRSFAVLLALGMKRLTLMAVLATTLMYVVVFAGLAGGLIGFSIFTWLRKYIEIDYAIVLPEPNLLLYLLISLLLILTVTIGSFIPAVRGIFGLSPRQILISGEAEGGAVLSIRSFLINTSATLLPLVLLAIFLLGDVVSGVLVILGIVVAYVLVAVVFYLILRAVYLQRHRFSFLIRSVIAQKKADGLFGVVSFTSLFVALSALCSLVLVQASLDNYLREDLSRSVPTTYVLDIQPSQKDDITTQFSDMTLFANIGARIIDIDGKKIQELIENDDATVDRELGREFNLTYRTELLDSESIVAGSSQVGQVGEISVDEDFATRADIELGSEMTFLIQGFMVSGTVTSIRSTDSRSGLPFFYFVLSPEDLRQFPGVYFGYSYYDDQMQTDLSRYLATNMPNVTVIETETLGPLLIQLVSTLLALIFIIAVPPLLIATLLIATLVISSYASRRREGARLRALGATKKTVLVQYLSETIVLTLLATVVAYAFGTLVSYGIGIYYIGITNPAWFDAQLMSGLGLTVSLIAILGGYLFISDTMPLRQLLAYEENH